MALPSALAPPPHRHAPRLPPPPPPPSSPTSATEEGGETVMPNLVGLQIEVAMGKLAEMHLAGTANPWTGQCEVSTVVSTAPPAGALIRTGDTVMLDVCSPAAIPSVIGIDIVPTIEPSIPPIPPPPTIQLPVLPAEPVPPPPPVKPPCPPPIPFP
ncbi:MAG: hypothetical protein HC884_18915 [Chloroflexaceae bacterium]|nr:hypothetical protein [Chloroflexaceae bacterium]